MAMPALKPLTIDELLDWDSGDDRRYELVNDVPAVVELASGAHQILVANLGRYLVEALETRSRAIPSVVEIVLLDQQQLYCEVHHRLDDGRWLTDLLRQPEARLRLESIGFDQPLSAIYSGVQIEE